MPIIKWAKKALRVSKKKEIRNRRSKNAYSDLRVAFEKAIKEEDAKTAKKIWVNEKKAKKTVKSGLQSTIDKLVKKNILHPNNGARKKAKYSKMLKAISK